jgi:hypothetical protein
MIDTEYSILDIKDSVTDAYEANLGCDPERVKTELTTALAKIDAVMDEEDRYRERRREARELEADMDRAGLWEQQYDRPW